MNLALAIFAAILITWLRISPPAILIRTPRRVKRKKLNSLKRLASYTKLQYVPFSLKGAYIRGVYRGVRLKVYVYAYTEIRLNLPNSSSEPYLKKRSKSDIRHILKRYPSVFASNDRSLVLQRKTVLYREGQARTNTYELRVLMDYLSDLVNLYPHIIQLGGEAVPILQPIALKGEHPLHNMAVRLLKEIGRFTTSTFESRLSQVCCKLCLTHFSSHKAMPGRVLSTQYYACRTCQQSRSYYEEIKLVLVLNEKMKEKWIQKDNALYVNGFKQRKLIDFDEVVIDHATDKAIASFAIKAGNDTDAYRTERYKDIPCTVMAGSSISENTMHMLERVFGRVQRKGDA